MPPPCTNDIIFYIHVCPDALDMQWLFESCLIRCNKNPLKVNISSSNKLKVDYNASIKLVIIKHGCIKHV